MMKSIEKLRELAADMTGTEILDHMEVSGKFLFHTEWLHSWHSEFDRLCDEIEREISERYMGLPVDADGVPIRVGDEINCLGRNVLVNSIIWDGVNWYASETVASSDWFPAKHSDHVKPRTLEDVLVEYRLEADRLFCDPSIGGEDRADALESLDARYAAEIRELMGVDE